MRAALSLIALIGIVGVLLNLSLRTADAQNKSPSVPWQSPEHKRWSELSQQASLAATRYYYSEAEGLHQQAIRVAERWGTEQGKLNKYVSLYNLGRLYLRWEKYPQAETCFRQALQLIEKLDGFPNSRSRDVLHALGKACWQQGKHKEAKGYLERALVAGSKNPDEETTAILLYELAILCEQLGQSPLAKSYREQKYYARDWQAKVLTSLAWLYTRWGRLAQAEALFQRALPIYEEMTPDTKPQFLQAIEFCEQYARLLKKTGQTTQTLKFEKRAQDLRTALTHLEKENDW